jgi:hypothetical protein
MNRRPFAIVALLLTLGACVPPPDQPAHPARIGRFIGLVARCDCSDVGEGRMAAEWTKVVEGRYTPADIDTMRGYVNAALTENFDNQIVVCADVCDQPCMVETVVAPLQGRSTGVAACPVTERDLRTPLGRFTGDAAQP